MVSREGGVWTRNASEQASALKTLKVYVYVAENLVPVFFPRMRSSWQDAARVLHVWKPNFAFAD